MFAFNKVTITFVTEMILMVVLIIAFIISIKKRKKQRLLRYFPYYLGFFLFVFLCGDISYFIAFRFDQKPLALGITSYTDYSSTLIELVVFLHFTYIITNNQVIRSSIPIVILLFGLFFLIEMQSDKFFPNAITERTQSRVYTIEATILMSYSIYNLFRIFNNKSIQTTETGVIFYITIGYFVFAVCTLPYSMMEPWLRRNYSYLSTELYSLFYIFYTLLFAFIIRAYVTKSKDKKLTISNSISGNKIVNK